MRVLVCGVPAAGKSTVCEELHNRNQWEKVIFSELMYQIGQQLKLIKGRGDLISLPPSKRRSLQQRALFRLDDIADGNPDKVWLIEGHLLVEQGNLLVPGLVFDTALFATAQIDMIAVITASAQEIVARRNNEASKYARHSKDNRFVERHLVMTQTAAAEICVRAGVPLAVIDNENNKQRGVICAQDLAKHIKDAR